MDFLSGILLAAVVLFTLGFFIKEAVGDHLVAMFTDRPERRSKGVNDHLVGAIGTVVEHAGDENAPLKVRVGIERWNAKTATDADVPLHVGTEVEVTAASALELTVIPRAKAPPS